MPVWLPMAAGKHPDRVAIECGERSITYAELSREAVDGMARLAGIGIEPGDRVALEIEDRFEFALALHSCLLHGSPALPVDLRLGEEQRAARRAAAKVEVTQWPASTGGDVALRSAGRDETDLVAAVMHTSGTTSAPKVVELTYGNWLASALASAAALGLDLEERWLCPMPLTHVGGLSILIRSAIYATTAVLQPGFDTEAVLGELMDPGRRITMVSLVPTMLARLLDAGLERPPTLRWALLGGAALPPALLERAARAGVAVAPTYGMTEACSQIATFGIPLHGLDLILQEPEREILVRGPMVAPGARDARGWLHTGDLGEIDERGRLGVLGRRDDTIISGGENIAPQEVEDALVIHPGVADAAVIGRPDPEWGQALVALVVPRDGPALDPEELRRHCAERLAGFKVPKAVELVDRLPRTNSGKLLRRELR